MASLFLHLWALSCPASWRSLSQLLIFDCPEGVHLTRQGGAKFFQPHDPGRLVLEITVDVALKERIRGDPTLPRRPASSPTGINLQPVTCICFFSSTQEELDTSPFSGGNCLCYF